MLWCKPVSVYRFPTLIKKLQTDKTYEIVNLYVDPTCRGSNLASDLIRFSENEMFQAGYRSVVSHVFKTRTASIKFHLKVGFQLSGTMVFTRFFGKNYTVYNNDIDIDSLFEGDKPAAIIIGRANPNMLGHLRSLGAVGLDLYPILIRKNFNLTCKTSRYTTKTYDFTKHKDPITEALSAIKKISLKYQYKPVLFVTNESDLHDLKKFEEELFNYVIMPSKPSTMTLLLNKDYQNSLAKSAQVPVPESFIFNKQKKCTIPEDSRFFPLLCRPTESSLAGNFKQKFAMYNSKQELEYALKKCVETSGTELLCQEFIEGDSADVYFAEAIFNHSGDVLSLVTGKKIREYPPGLMSSGKSQVASEIADHTGKLAREIKQAGLFGIEFKYCKKSNQYYFIEANLRADNFVSIGVNSNVNLPLHYFLVAHGNESALNPWVQTESEWVDFVADSVAIFKQPHSTRQKFRLILRNLTGAPKDCAFQWNDPLPGVCWHGSRIFSGLSGLKNKKSSGPVL
jgi:predicted ATP-grasp superfamily ATP-dependent carboligase